MRGGWSTAMGSPWSLAADRLYVRHPQLVNRDARAAPGISAGLRHASGLDMVDVRHKIRRLTTTRERREGSTCPRVRRPRRAAASRRSTTPSPGPATCASASTRARSTTSTSTSAKASRASTIDLPHIPGLEVVGRVAELGEGVDGLAGRRPRRCRTCSEATCFIGVGRSLPRRLRRVRHVGAHAKQLAERSPSDLRRRRRGPAGRLRHRLAHALHPRRPAIGETVLVNSVASGIGSAAVQLAKLAGAYVIGTSSSRREARPRGRARHGRRHRLHAGGRPRARDAS